MSDSSTPQTRRTSLRSGLSRTTSYTDENNVLTHSERIESKHRWDELRAETVYSTWEWGTVCENFGHDRYYLGIERDGELRAGIPLMFNDSRLFGKKLVSMPYAPYGSILIRRDAANPHEYRQHLIEDLQSLTDSLSADQASIRGYNAMTIDDPNFTTTNEFVTFEVDLRNGEDQVWEDVASRFRRGVRKARKNDVRVEKGFDDSSFAAYYEMYLDNMHYYGTPPYSRRFFRNVHTVLGERDAFELYLAYDDEGRPINGVTAFFHGDRAIYWTGVSDHEYRELNGGSLLLWEAMSDACDRGYPIFDLGRTREGTGVYRYKDGIGNPVELIDRHYAPDGVDRPPNPDDGYDTYKTIWRKLPVKLTEYLGPHLRRRLTI